jgi:outer membrane lipoprotein LolB
VIAKVPNHEPRNVPLSRRHFCLAIISAPLFGAGCAQKQLLTHSPEDNAYWSGRLSLATGGDRSQSFSAGFELSGSAVAGRLHLYSPFGNTLAEIQWNAQSAELRSSAEVKNFASLDQLAAHLTSAPLPISSLFQWLQGVPTVSNGWQADLREIAEGRLTVRQTQTDEAAELKLVFEPAAPR